MTSSPKRTTYKGGKGGDVIIKDRQTAGHTIHQQIEARQHFRSSQFDAQSSLYTTTFTSILFNSFSDELNHIKVDVLSIQCSYIHVIGLYLSQPYYP